MHHLILLAAETAETVDHGEDPFSPGRPRSGPRLIWAAVFFIVLLVILYKVALAEAARRPWPRARRRSSASLQRRRTPRPRPTPCSPSTAPSWPMRRRESQQIIDEGAPHRRADRRRRAGACRDRGAAITARAQADIAAERDRAIDRAARRARRRCPSSWPAGSSASRSTRAAQRALVDSYIDELASEPRY